MICGGRPRGFSSSRAQQHFQPLRLIGAAADRLTRGSEQMPLFADPDQQKRRRLDQAMDQITERFGPDSIARGAAGNPGPVDHHTLDNHGPHAPEWYE